MKTITLKVKIPTKFKDVREGVTGTAGTVVKTSRNTVARGLRRVAKTLDVKREENNDGPF